MKKLPPFKAFVLQNFPFIEEDFDALTYYEILCKIIEKLKLTDEQVEKITEIINNFNVQEEVDKKLDEMAEDGTLEELINQEIFNEINNKIEIINSNDTILIGDSYGVGYTIVNNEVTYVNSWCYWFQRLMNLTDEHCYKFVEGGIGFADSGQGGHLNFLDLLQSNINTITNKNLIKNIVVCGGYNDKNQNFSAINTAIANFITYCKTQFPNAKVYIGMIANDGNNTTVGVTARNIIRDTVLIAYQNCSAHGGIYLNGVENVMHYYPNFGEDNYHPSENGYRILGSNIFQAFKNGKTTYILPYINATINNSNISNFGTMRIGCQMCDNLVNFKITEGRINFTNSISLSADYIILGVVDFPCFRYTNIPNLAIPTFIGIVTDDNNYYGAIGTLTVNSNYELVIGFRPYKNDGTVLPNINNINSIFFGTANISIPTINS